MADEALQKIKYQVELHKQVDQFLNALDSAVKPPKFDGSISVADWRRQLDDYAQLNSGTWLISNADCARYFYERHVDVNIKKRILYSLTVNADLKRLWNNGACNAEDYVKCLSIVQYRDQGKSLVELGEIISKMRPPANIEEGFPAYEKIFDDIDAFVANYKKDEQFVELFRHTQLVQSTRDEYDEFVRGTFPNDKPKRDHVLAFVAHQARRRLEAHRIRAARDSQPKSENTSPSPSKPKQRAEPSSPSTSVTPKMPAPKMDSLGPASRTRAKGRWQPGDPFHGICHACRWAATKGRPMHEGGKHPAGDHCPYFKEWKDLPQDQKYPRQKEGSTAMLTTASEGVYIAATVHLEGDTVMEPIFLDTGSGVNMVSAAYVSEHHIPTRAAPALHLRGLSTVITHRVADLDIILNRQVRHVTFYVVADLPTRLLLGQRYMAANAIDIANSSKTVIIGGEGAVPFVSAVTGQDDVGEQLSLALIAREAAPSPLRLLDFPEEQPKFMKLGKAVAAAELLHHFAKETHGSVAMLASETDASSDRVDVNKDLPAADRQLIIDTAMSKPGAWFDPDAPDSLGQAKGVEFTIPMDPEVEKRPPVLPRPTRYAPADYAVISAWVRESLRIGRIERAPIARFLSRLVVVRTRDEHGNVKIRICLDLRVVNKWTLKLPYPQRHPFEILTELSGYNWLGSIDLRMSFEQVPLAEADRCKTAFWFDGQLYHFKVMTFGAINAPFVMQRIVDQCLEPVRDLARSLIDDILLTVKGSIEDYCVALGRVLDRLIAFNLRGALHKAKLGYTSLDALGHVVSGLGVAIPSRKVAAIVNLAPPVDAKAAVSVLAGFQFYRRFIPAFSEIIKPIHELTLPGAEWHWGAEQDAAWKSIKAKFAEAPILRHPVAGKPVFIRTDASGYAIAAVYLQAFEDEPGKPFLHPVAYWSRKLTKLERGRGATETEFLAFDEALQEGYYLCYGAELTLESDCKAIEYILNNPNFANDRLKRSAMRIQEFYPIKCVHRQGKSPQMSLVDAMSRDAQYLLSAPGQVLDKPTALLASPAPAMTIAEAQKADPVISALIESVVSGSPTTNAQAEALRLEFKDNLHVRDGVLYHIASRRGRIVARYFVPESLRAFVAEECHKEAHARAEALYARVLSRYFWPGAYKDLDSVANNCTLCAEVNATHERYTGFMRARTVGYPGEALWFDYLDMPVTKEGYTCVLTAVDPFDCYPWAIPLRSKTLEETVQAILIITLDNDPPKYWGADNAPQFLHDAMQEAARLLGVQPRSIPTYMPRANPDERLNREVRDLLAKLAHDEPARWAFHLPFALRGLRTAERAVLGGQSPYMLRRGRRPVSVLERHLGVEPDPMRVEDYATAVGTEVAKGIKIAYEARERARQDTDRQLQALQRVGVFQVGDAVMVERMNRTGIEPRYTGPYKITKVLDENMFLLDMPAGEQPVHMSRFKKFVGDADAASTQVAILDKGDPADWIPAPKADQEALNPQTIIGSRVRVYWHKFRQWFDGIVVRRAGRMHEVYYWDLEEHTYNERLIGYPPNVGARWKLLRPRTSALRGGGDEK